MKHFLVVLSFVCSFTAGALLGKVYFDRPTFGVALPSGTAVFETSLASRMTSTDSSFEIVSASTRGGGTLSGYQCFTIDEGKTEAEFVCGDLSGTTVSNLERGLDPLTGTSTIASLKSAHRVGASVKITDFPLIQRMKSILNAEEAIPALIYATSTALIDAGSPTTTLATKYYVDNLVVAGASDANETTKGIIELATASELADGTSSGGTGARLAVPASQATSTPNASTATGAIPTSIGRYLSQAWLDLSEAFTWTAHHTFTSLFATNASSTHATTTSLYIGSLDGVLKATSGQVSTAVSGTDYAAPQYQYIQTSNVAASNGYASSTTFNIPSGTMTASSTVEAVANITFAASGNPSIGTLYLKSSDGLTLLSCQMTNVGVTEAGNVLIKLFADNSTSAQTIIFSGVVHNTNDNGSDSNTLQCEDTSSVDFSSGGGLVLVVNADSGDTFTIQNIAWTYRP